MADKLKLCPIEKCKGDAELLTDDFLYQTYKVRCSKCEWGTEWYRNKEKAVEAWNRRADNG